MTCIVALSVATAWAEAWFVAVLRSCSGTLLECPLVLMCLLSRGEVGVILVSAHPD
jgi:hypothetical protein